MRTRRLRGFGWIERKKTYSYSKTTRINLLINYLLGSVVLVLPTDTNENREVNMKTCGWYKYLT